MRKLLLLTITAFFLFSFLTTNGQTNPTVTINQWAAQPDPTNSAPINFMVVFDQPVIGFTTGDVVITGTTGTLIGTVTGINSTTYNVAVTGMTSCGTITATIPAGVCTNTPTQPNLASTSTDNTVTYLPSLPNPNVTINQALSQPDPTNSSPINFTVVFDQQVTGFATGDVTLSGTAGATTAIVTGSGNYYNVAVSGITSSGTVIATITAGVSQNACTQPNNASTSTDNTVTITCVPPIVNVTPATSCGGVAGLGCNGPLTASGNADVYVWSPLAGLYTNCTMTIAYTGTNLSTVYAGPTTNTIYTVTGTKLATGCTNAASAQVYYTPPAPVVTPPSVNMCLGDAGVKIKVTTGGIPTTPAVWSPAAGLFRDPAAAIPYIAGTPVDSVWVRPTPAGIYTYQVTTQGLSPSTCTSPPRSVTVRVVNPVTITSQPANQALCPGAVVAVFSVSIAGSGPNTYQWQLSTNGGTTWNNTPNVGPYSGVNTLFLTINPVTAGMNGYLYRLLINGGTSCSATSNAGLLTINPLPTAVITANPLVIGPTQTTTIYSTVTANPAATYAWYYNNSVLPGAVADTLLVNYGSAGNYQLKVTNACGVGLSNIITIANSFALNMYTYPNPSGGIFQVRYNSEAGNTLQRSLTVYNNRGEKIITRNFTQTIPYQKIDVDIRQHGKGLYWVEVRDANGKRLGMNRVVVQ